MQQQLVQMLVLASWQFDFVPGIEIQLLFRRYLVPWEEILVRFDSICITCRNFEPKLIFDEIQSKTVDDSCIPISYLFDFQIKIYFHGTD